MKNTIKKISAFLLSLVLLLGIVPLADLDITASAKTYSGTCGDNLTWTLDTETGELVISGEGEMYDWTYGSPPWYNNKYYIRTVTIAEGVTSIGNHAFYNCYNIANINVSNSITSIGFDAFRDTAYYSNDLNWENGIVLYIDDCLIAVKSSLLSGNLVIKEGTKIIADNAVSGCGNLISVTIPNTVTRIGNGAFSTCDELTYIRIPDSVITIGDSAFYYCIRISGVEIGNNVISIGQDAFYGNSRFTSIVIPDSVTNIGEGAFADCSQLEKIVVSSANIAYSVDEEGVLFNKTKTKLVQYPSGKTSKNYTIPDSVTGIGDSAFYSCDNLASIDIPDSVTNIGDYTFKYCSSLTSIDIPDKVTHIGNSAFADCKSLTSVTISNSVTSIGDYTFEYCSSLINIDIPDKVTSIGNSAFADCKSLTSVTIGNSVTSIGDSAFNSCYSLASIDIPDKVTSIGDYTFGSCSSLTSIDIPDKVTHIGISAFANCQSLTSIAVDQANTAYSSDDYGVLFNKDQSLLIRYPIGNAMTDYTIPDSVSSIGDSAFSSCKMLTSIDIPNSVTSIGYAAFAGCSSLTSVTIGNSVTSIGDSAFSSCKMLTSIDIPNSVASIGDSTFESCDSLASVAIGNSVTSIGEGAFRNCSGLTSVTIGNSVTSISGYAFYGCKSLTSATIGNGVTRIGGSAFRFCSSLTDVYYNGTEEQWNEITIGSYNNLLLNANIHFLGEDVHECDYTAVVTPPTCQTQGYTTYTCEECGDSYVDDYTDTVDHYYLDGKCIWCGDTNVTPSSIIDITYTPSDSARKLFTVTCADRAQMIQFIEPDGGTRTYYRNNTNVKITSYNADGEVVGDLSRDLAYEVWEIYSNMSIGTTIKVRAKFNSRWELDKRSLVVYEYNPVISMELSRTSGKKGPVPATVVADEKTENVKFKMPNGTSVTVTQFTTDENGNRVFKGNAWANEDGLNVITVTIRRKNVTKTVGTLEYTVE